jgi:hypothetical protein
MTSFGKTKTIEERIDGWRRRGLRATDFIPNATRIPMFLHPRLGKIHFSRSCQDDFFDDLTVATKSNNHHARDRISLAVICIRDYH